MSDVSRILCSIDQGDQQAAEQLLPLVYAELRRLAAQRLACERPGQTLTATGLVHDAYLRLVGPADAPAFNSRGHFFAAAAEAMRRILIERARRRRSLKHGGKRTRVELNSACLVADGPSLDILAVDEALTRLASEQPEKAELVKLRFFGGLSTAESAAAMGISLATAERYWAFARGWLYAELADRAPPNAD